MSLYTRLLGLDPAVPRIPVHTFMAALGEWERGFLTQAQIVTAFGLSGPETTEAVTLVAKLVAPREALTLACVPAGHALTNIGTAYDGTGGTALGYTFVQASGITQVIFAVRVNKIGTGTQSWQLWNETDGSEITVIDDAGAAGLKSLQVTRDFAQPLAPGMKTVRVRAKSTVAADDPVYFSAVASVRRASNLTAVELHEVLLLAEPTDSPLHTEAALKTRLGV